jgi:menaquinol-cytochrome c reductase cytochrome b/c subunit
MKQAQKESYKRDYAAAKADGKPFFPYAIYKDHIVALFAIAVVILLAIVARVHVGEPINPATTDFVPRPEWYFFFLFELLKIFKNQNAFLPLIMATFIIPNILMALLFLVPFIDRGPERRIWKRPFALMSAGTIMFFLCYLTYVGATAPEGGGKGPVLSGLDAQAQSGYDIYVASPCKNCHVLKGFGIQNVGAPSLDNESAKKRGEEWQIAHLKDPQSKTQGSQMLAFKGQFTEKQFADLAYFLEGLGTKYK